MEEFGPTPTQVEETPTKRRRFLPGNFLHSWLDRRDDDQEKVKPKKKKAKVEAQKDSQTEYDWKPERMRDRFRNFFRGLVSIESVESFRQTDVKHYEPLESEPEQSRSEKPLEGGILAVSANAQRQYYGHELANQAAEDGPEALPEIEVDDIETDHPSEQDHGSAEIFTTAALSAETNPGTVEPVGDVIRRRQEDRLNRRVKRLRRQSRSMRHQQSDMQDRQSSFERHLDENQKAQQKFEQEIVPKMEADRKKLRQRLEETPEPVKVKFELPTAGAEITETSGQKVKIKTEAEPIIEKQVEIIAEPEKIDKIIKPETNKKAAETNFEDDGYRETYYERRHEVKDDPTPLLSPVSSSFTSPTRINGAIVPPPIYKQATTHPHPVWTNQTAWSDFYHRISPKPGPDMYKKSAINGAIGGIIIIILLGLLTLVR